MDSLIFSVEDMQIAVLVGAYCIIIGVMIVSLWVLLLSRRMVPELKTAPWTIYLHVSAELLTASILLIAGLGAIFLSFDPMVMLLPLGMLLYTCINSAGYYVQARNKPMIAMFALLTLLTILSIGLLLGT